jgi:hypothetical protein
VHIGSHLLAQKANLFCSRLHQTAETQIGVAGRLDVTKYSIQRDNSHNCKMDRWSQLARSRALDFVSTLTVLSPPLWRRSNESTKYFGEVSLVREAYACGHLGTDDCAIDQDGQKMRCPALDGNDRSCVAGFAFCRVQR